MFTTKINKFIVSGFNQEEFHLIKNEIFGSNSYYFDIKKENPLIIDLGSHIGVSILYFKSFFPNSKILAYEPNPKLFEKLVENVFINNLKNIELYNLAVSDKEGDFKLHVDSKEGQWYSTGGYKIGGWTGTQTTEEITVPSVKLSTILNNKEVDILKIDIEGLELKVLLEAKEYLKNVKNIVAEYHPDKESKEKLSKIIKILNTKFNLEILDEGKVVKKYDEKRLLLIRGELKSSNRHL